MTQRLQHSLTLAQRHHAVGELSEAKGIYRKILRDAPNHPITLHLMGVIAYQNRENDVALDFIKKALIIKPDYAEAHSNLGAVLRELGRLNDAEESYKKALSIKPDFAETHSNLGHVLHALGKFDEAADSLRKAVGIEPDLPGVQHRLNALLGITTDFAPRQYVEDIFNSYAKKFDNHLVNVLKYDAPIMLKKALLDLGLAQRKYKNVIDLGCGTGLSGLEFRDIAETLIGIDLSEEMVRKAEQKNIYDRLYVDDIVGRLEILKTQFSLFISSDVFAYIGDLLPLFSCIKRHSTQNSLLVFSTEHTDDGDFILRNTARYAHSKDYILSIAKQQGFRLEFFTTCNLRYERDGWIIGGLFVLKVT